MTFAAPLSVNRVIGSVVALFTPLSSARTAIVDGMIASNVISCGGLTEFSGDCFFMASPSPQNNEVSIPPFAANHSVEIAQPALAPNATSSPTICTAMTFTMVIDGKIIA
jgi:hypothetical protein